MKSIIEVLFMILSTNAHAELTQICGILSPNEACISESANLKSDSSCLLVPETDRLNEAYFLMPQTEEQLERLQSMKKYERYCVTGDLFWCGRGKNYKCITMDSIQN